MKSKPLPINSSKHIYLNRLYHPFVRWAFYLIVSLSLLLIFALITLPLGHIINFWGASSVSSTSTLSPDQLTSVASDIVSLVIKETDIPQMTSTAFFVPTNQILPEILDNENVPMILVPEGEFFMGESVDKSMQECRKYLNDCQRIWFETSAPIHKVYLDSYYIDVYEVTNGRYKNCVDAGVCVPPKASASSTQSNYYESPQFNDYPVVNVDWNMARTYCEWRGAFLPSEAQWEKAARGIDGRDFPWGTNLSCEEANYAGCIGDTTSVGIQAMGVSPYGLYDMAGNVSEWVEDWFLESYYQTVPYNNPTGPASGQYKIIRGGSWFGVGLYARTSIRVGLTPTYFDRFVGFRCASRNLEGY